MAERQLIMHARTIQPLSFQVYRLANGQPKDLTGFAVSLYIFDLDTEADRSKILVTKSGISIDDAPNGVVSTTLTESDLNYDNQYVDAWWTLLLDNDPTEKVLTLKQPAKLLRNYVLPVVP
jgi:hypothetical protein